MKKSILYIGLLIGWSIGSKAQVFEPGDEPGTVQTGAVKDNFFVEMGLDMALQNPYGYNFAHVFPNGKTFGLDIAGGKWFSPQVGAKVKLNWENKLPLLKNDHANWLAPFYQPGVNRDKGGYVAFYMDALLNMHNFFGAYRPDRTWNLSVYPRAGLNYNFGVSKGALLLGLGIQNTYRLNDRWSLYADLAYMMTGSGFVGSEKVEGTGTGSNSNGYFSVGIGAQYSLVRKQKNKKDRLTEEQNRDRLTKEQNRDRIKEEQIGGGKADGQGVLTNGIWDNWFAQAGIDMSLMIPYGIDLSSIIPKGQTFGLNAAFGKWFTPEFALRARVQWDNGLIENKSLEWVAPRENPRQNYKEGGIGTASIEGVMNLTNFFAGYESEKKWHTNLFIRAGLITQFAVNSASPLLGIGLEETYRLTDKLSLFGSLCYQGSTSEGMGYGFTGMDVAAGNNGFVDVDFGVVMDLGEHRFCKTAEEKEKAYGQTVGKHNWSRFVVNTASSIGIAYVGKTALKAVIKEERPDHSDDKSFPSGHASMAFAAARSIDKEFRKESIWIPVVGYAAATAIGVERVVNDKHHWYDVVAGAGVGVVSAELAWWLSEKLFPKQKRNIAVGTSGRTVDVAVVF